MNTLRSILLSFLLSALAPATPTPLSSKIEFSSFEIGTNPASHHPYCLLFLDGTYREKISIVPTSVPKEKLSSISLTDSTGKNYQPETILVSPNENDQKEGKREFSIQISLPQWPSGQTEWMHLQGDIPVTCTHPLSLNPVEVELSHQKEIKIPLLGNDIPQPEDVADLSRLEYLSLWVEKGKDKDKDTCTWKISIGFSIHFGFHGFEFEDMQGRPIPTINHIPGSLFAGGGGATASDYYTFPRSLKKIRVRVLYFDSRHFETKLLHADIKFGMGGTMPHNHAAAKK